MSWTTPVVPVAATLITSSWGTTSVVDNLSYLYANQGIFPLQVRRNNPIGPFTISASTNDYNPAGLSTCNRLILDPSGGSQTITGIVAQADGVEIEIMNPDTGANDIILAHANGGSSASNRFNCAGGANVNIRPGGVVTISYWGNDARWHPSAV
jgi:hypothetical protein